MSGRSQNGFTIVEMLMVVAILGVLIGIVTTAAGSAIRESRFKRTQSMMAVLQAGLATYYAQKDEWPGKLKTLCDGGPSSQLAKEYRIEYLSDTEADKVFQELINETIKGSQMLDVSGLFVAEASKAKSGSTANSRGMDFRAAVTKTDKRGKLSPSQLAYGYPAKSTGNFRRYIIRYNFDTDSVTVMTQNESGSGHDYHDETGKTWEGTPPTTLR